jgi:hypothetical protein
MNVNRQTTASLIAPLAHGLEFFNSTSHVMADPGGTL